MKTASSMQPRWLSSRLAFCAAAVVVAGLQLGQSVAPAAVSLRQLAAQTREQAQDQDEHDDAPQDVAVTEQLSKFVLRRSAWSPTPRLVALDTLPHRTRLAHSEPRDASGWLRPTHSNPYPPQGVRLLV